MSGANSLTIIRRVFSWFVLVVLILTLVLILRKSDPPDVTVDPAAAAAAGRKLDAAAQAAQSGQPAQVALDSTELNSYLAQNLQLAGSNSTNSGGDAGTPAVDGVDPQTVEQAASSVEAVKIALEGEVVKTYVVFDFHGKDLSLEIDGHLYAQDGYLKFDPLDGKVGSFPLPQSALQQAVQRMMESPENREKLRLPADVSNVEVQNSQVVVSYR